MNLHGKIIVIKRNGTDGAHFPLTANCCLFGRGLDCDIRIQLPTVDPEQCQIEIDEKGHVFMKNMSKSAPTLLNKKVLSNSLTALSHGDEITIVDRKFRFEFPGNSRFFPKSPKGKSPKSSPGSSLTSLSSGHKSASGATPIKPLSPRSDNVPSSSQGKSPTRSRSKSPVTGGSKSPGRPSSNTGPLKPSSAKKDKSKSPAASSASPDFMFGLSPASFYKASVTPNALKKLSLSNSQQGKRNTPVTKMTPSTSNQTPKGSSPRSAGAPKRSSSPGALEKKLTGSPYPKGKQNLRKSISDLRRRSVPVLEAADEASPAGALCGQRKKTPKSSGKKRKLSPSGQSVSSAKRKRVSFGPSLSPEHFDKYLPPKTPVKKGATPSRSDGDKRKSLLKRKSLNVKHSPKSTSPRARSLSPKKAPFTINMSPGKKRGRPPSNTPKAASPIAKTPEAKTPKAASPRPKTPEAETPKAASPRAKTPEAKTPKAASPRVKTLEAKAASPRAKTPEAKTPKAASPRAKTPDAKTPKTASPRAKTPEAKAASPRAKTPEAKAASPRAKTPDAKTPKAASPRAKTPDAKTPKAASPRAKTPEAKTPKAASPRAKTPEAKTPKAASPRAKTPDAKTPKAASPRAKTPEAKTPKAASPRAKTPDAKTPKAASPRAKTPEAKAASPRAKTPEAKAASPRAKTPDAKTPKAASPRAKTPDAKTPKAASPRAKTPEAKTPKSASPRAMTPKSAKLVTTNSSRSQKKTPKSQKHSPKSSKKVLAETMSYSPDLFSQMSPIVVTSKPSDGGDDLNMTGVSHLLKTPQGRKSSSPAGLKRMFETPKEEMDARPSGIKRGMKTPKVKHVKVVGVSPTGVKRLLKTPKVKRAGQAVNSPTSLKRILKTPKGKQAVQASLVGVKELVKTPKAKADANLSGLEKLFATPDQLPKGMAPWSTGNRSNNNAGTPKPQRLIKPIDTPRPVISPVKRIRSPKKFFGDSPENELVKNRKNTPAKSFSPRVDQVTSKTPKADSNKKLGKSPHGKTPKSGKKERATPASQKKQGKTMTMLSSPVGKIVAPPKDLNKVVALRAIHGHAVTPKLAALQRVSTGTPLSSKKKMPGSGKKGPTIRTWSDIVKTGAPVVKPAIKAGATKMARKKSPVPSKKTVGKTPKTPRALARALAPSTGHAESPVTILVGRKAILASRTKTPKPQPRKGRKKSMNKAARKSAGNTSFSGIPELFKTPELATSASLNESALYADIPDTPEGPNEMFVSPISANKSKGSGRKSYGLGGVKGLFLEKKVLPDPNLVGVKELFTTVKPSKVLSPTGVSRIMKTPRKKAAAVSPSGLKRLVASPRVKNQAVSPSGIEILFSSPKATVGIEKKTKSPKPKTPGVQNNVTEITQAADSTPIKSGRERKRKGTSVPVSSVKKTKVEIVKSPSPIKPLGRKGTVKVESPPKPRGRRGKGKPDPTAKGIEVPVLLPLDAENAEVATHQGKRGKVIASKSPKQQADSETTQPIPASSDISPRKGRATRGRKISSPGKKAFPKLSPQKQKVEAVEESVSPVVSRTSRSKSSKQALQPKGKSPAQGKKGRRGLPLSPVKRLSSATKTKVVAFDIEETITSPVQPMRGRSRAVAKSAKKTASPVKVPSSKSMKTGGRGKSAALLSSPIKDEAVALELEPSVKPSRRGGKSVAMKVEDSLVSASSEMASPVKAAARSTRGRAKASKSPLKASPVKSAVVKTSLPIEEVAAPAKSSRKRPVPEDLQLQLTSPSPAKCGRGKSNLPISSPAKPTRGRPAAAKAKSPVKTASPAKPTRGRSAKAKSPVKAASPAKPTRGRSSKAKSPATVALSPNPARGRSATSKVKSPVKAASPAKPTRGRSAAAKVKSPVKTASPAKPTRGRSAAAKVKSPVKTASPAKPTRGRSTAAKVKSPVKTASPAKPTKGRSAAAKVKSPVKTVSPAKPTRARSAKAKSPAKVTSPAKPTKGRSAAAKVNSPVKTTTSAKPTKGRSAAAKVKSPVKAASSAKGKSTAGKGKIGSPKPASPVRRQTRRR